MAHETSKITGVAIDNSAGTLTTISGSVNSVDANKAFDELEDTGLGDSLRTYVDGLGDAPEISMNGYLNSTTRDIFLPLLYSVTSVSNVKTVAIQYASGVWRKGEATVRDVNAGISTGALNAWSATFRPTGAFSQTSVLGS